MSASSLLVVVVDEEEEGDEDDGCDDGGTIESFAQRDNRTIVNVTTNHTDLGESAISMFFVTGEGNENSIF